MLVSSSFQAHRISDPESEWFVGALILFGSLYLTFTLGYFLLSNGKVVK